MATQNPIESEGTYPLPEAQIDRFMLKILIGYPEHDEELTIVERQLAPPPELREALTLDELKALQRAVFEIYVDPALVSYAVNLATATRQASDYVATGPARADRSASFRRPARSRSSAAASTSSQRISKRSSRTHSATASSSRTRRWPRR